MTSIEIVRGMVSEGERVNNAQGVIDILKECHLAHTPNTDTSLPGGVHVTFPESDIVMSIMTHVWVTNGEFCEICLKCKGSCIYISSLGYDDVCRFDQDELYDHLIDFPAKVKGRTYESFANEESNDDIDSSDSDYIY